MKIIEEKTMTRSSILTLGVIVLLVLLGIGYYSTYQPAGELRAACTNSFSSLDSATDDMKLDQSEFLAYGAGVSADDFARADVDKDQNITLQEFCNWEGARTETG